jgi:hypothetical protein
VLAYAMGGLVALHVAGRSSITSRTGDTSPACRRGRPVTVRATPTAMRPPPS